MYISSFAPQPMELIKSSGIPAENEPTPQNIYRNRIVQFPPDLGLIAPTYKCSSE